MITLLFLWPMFALLIGILAKARGRSGLAWFVLALVFSPLVAGLALLLLPEGRAGKRQCPTCAEYVRVEASKCHHCGHEFVALGSGNFREFWNDVTLRDKIRFACYLAVVPVMIFLFIDWKDLAWRGTLPANVGATNSAAPEHEPPASVYEKARKCEAKDPSIERWECHYVQYRIQHWEDYKAGENTK